MNCCTSASGESGGHGVGCWTSIRVASGGGTVEFWTSARGATGGRADDHILLSESWASASQAELSPPELDGL